MKGTFKKMVKEASAQHYSTEELLYSIYQEIGGNSIKSAQFSEALESYIRERNLTGVLSIKSHEGQKKEDEEAKMNLDLGFERSAIPNEVPPLHDFLINILKSMKWLSLDRSLLPLSDHISVSIWDRYQQDFDEVCVLGEGGFGTVFKARHRLDGQEYAVKKVQIRLVSRKDYEILLREVRVLSELRHPHIAQYCSSWLQMDALRPESRLTEEFTESSLSLSPHQVYRAPHSLDFPRSFLPSSSSSSSSGGIEFRDSKDDGRSPPYPNLHQKPAPPSGMTDVGAQFPSSPNASFQFHKPLSQEGPCCSSGEQLMSVVPCLSSVSPSFRVPTLYIQMELGGESLLKWIQTRNERVRLKTFYWNKLELNTHLRIFREILLALEYIHGKGIVHRDIKPENILLSAPDGQVLLADFGLATLFMESELSSRRGWANRRSRLSTLVGTPTYCAPEIAKGNLYDTKVDIYGLGIILLELMQPVTSMSERAKVIEGLKQWRKVQCLLTNKWKFFSRLILDMTERDPSRRPSASEILSDLAPFWRALSSDPPPHIPPSPPPPTLPHPSSHTRIKTLSSSASSPRSEKPPSKAVRKTVKRSRTFPNVSAAFRPAPPKRRSERAVWTRYYIEVVTAGLMKDKQIESLTRRVKELEKQVAELELGQT